MIFYELHYKNMRNFQQYAFPAGRREANMPNCSLKLSINEGNNMIKIPKSKCKWSQHKLALGFFYQPRKMEKFPQTETRNF